MCFDSLLKTPPLNGLEKRPQGILQNRSALGFFDECSFKTVLGIFLSPLAGLKSVK
jgi:hypothetical protein